VLWSRFGRGRVVVRTVGVLLTEVTVVLAVGLVVNRSEHFYPSWAALSGDTGTDSAPAPARGGELDATLAGRSSLPWHPRDLHRWGLATAPTVTVLPDYLAPGSAQYPVLVTLGRAGTFPAPVPGVVTVALAPTRTTTAQALRTLVTDLDRDFRVTARGWAVVAGADEAALAGQLARALPAQFQALAVVERSPAAGLASLGRIPPGTALATVGPESARGRAPKVTSGVVPLTAATPQAWPTAIAWTTTQLGPALTPPLLLSTRRTR
jgi:lysyl-tRNA synthetase class 2